MSAAYDAITAAIGTHPLVLIPLTLGHRHHERGKEGAVFPVIDDSTTPVSAVDGAPLLTRCACSSTRRVAGGEP